jgi:phage virion morphogenesis protein
VSGSFVFDDEALVLGIKGLALTPARSLGLMRVLGQALVETTRERFQTGTDPWGRAWAPLLPAYAQFKRGTKILVVAGMRGGLMGSIHYDAAPGRVVVGTDKIYGAVHQFGAVIRPKNAKALVFRLGPRLVRVQSVTIPARPFLGFGPKDIGAIEEATGAFLGLERL